MNHGSIEVLNRKQILLSSEIIHLLQLENNSYDKIKEISRQDFHEFCNEFGSKRKELMANIEDIFNLYGLGRLEIKEVDSKNKSAKLNLFNSSIAHVHLNKNKESGKAVCNLTCAVLSGIFSYLFDEDIDCREQRCYAKGDEFCQFVVKKRGVDR
ncbi:hypothetical protein GF327_06260 [Candidatus Woesearchaeota archaeon]|nr:hypothetical protein [Candidatus Woesearchaeota archaeon]